jgi:hypothetical protein
VTRRGAERTRLHPLNEWEFSNSGFNGQKRSKMNAIAIGTMAREIWLRLGLVNGAPTKAMPSFDARAACSATHISVAAAPKPQR